MERKKPESQTKNVNFEIEADLDEMVEKMSAEWKWPKKAVFNHIVRSFFKRHGGVPKPNLPPD